MFFARKEEFNKIKNLLLEPGKHCVIYGNRRVGKTTLAMHSLKESGVPFISYECIKSSLLDNTVELCKQLYEQGIIPSEITFYSITDLFSYLNSLNKRIAVFIDEYPYLYSLEKQEYVDSLFQKILDQYSSNLNIIFSGSHIGMMKQLNTSSNPLFGRVMLTIDLFELDYKDSSEFYPNLSCRDKAAFYAIFGGTPFVLENINPSKSLVENIKETILCENSVINAFVKDGYTTDLQAKQRAASIFRALGNSKYRYSKLEDVLNLEHNGLLGKYLTNLIEMGFIRKIYPINKPSDDKKARFEIKNNLLRFYYTYVYGKENIIKMIGVDAFFDQYISPSLLTYISYRYEEICKQYISRLAKNKILTGVLDIGSYYYDDSISKTNGEFDIAIKKSDGRYDLIEAKYYINSLSEDEMNKEIDQVKKIKDIEVDDVGFISLSGYKKKLSNYKYLITGDDLYN